jgi:hypothetical protein
LMSGSSRAHFVDAVVIAWLVASGGLSVASKLLVALVLAVAAGAIAYVWKRTIAKQ